MAKFHGFGDPARESITGPLIGGGLTQVGMIGAKMLGKTRPTLAKYASLIGLLVGGGVSAVLAFRPRTRGVGISGLVTAAIVGIPPLLSDVMGVGMHDGFGVITSETGMMGLGEGEYSDAYGVGEPPVRLMDSGSGSTGALGVYTTEGQTAGAPFGAGDPVSIQGAFGSNWLQ